MKDLLKMVGASRLTCHCSTSPIFLPAAADYLKRQSRDTLPPSEAPETLTPLPTFIPAATPPHPHPFLLTLAKPLCMLIGGGLIQFAAVVDQWWITFPSFGCASLAGGGGRTWRRKQQRSRSVASERDNVCLCFPRQLSLPILLQNNNNVFSDQPLCVTDGSGLWHRAALTRSDFVSAGAGGGRTQERKCICEDLKPARPR